MSSTIKVNNIQNLAGDDSGIDLSTNDQIILKTANTTAITVDSSQDTKLAGKLGIGATTIDSDIHLEKASDLEIKLERTGSGTSTIGVPSSGFLNINNTSNAGMTFSTNNTQRMLINNGGQLTFGTTNLDPAQDNQVGISFSSNGSGSNVTGVGQFSCAGAVAIRGNRTNEDGVIIAVHQAGTQEGTISISGSTTSYNAFSGSHWSRFTDNSKPTILKGTVIETIDEMCDWYQITFTVPATDEEEEYIPKIPYALQDGQSVGDTLTYNHNGTDYQATIIQEDDNKHTKCKISDTEDSTRVYGVFADWDNDDDSVNDMYVTAVGTHVVRVNQDETVSAGDLLVSNGDGTAKVQDDDIIRSKTIGKVLTNIKQETYDDGSYIVPCALYCG